MIAYPSVRQKARWWRNEAVRLRGELAEALWRRDESEAAELTRRYDAAILCARRYEEMIPVGDGVVQERLVGVRCWR